MKPALLILLFGMALLGCSREPDRRQIVVLIDVSGSIEPGALEQGFKAVDGLVGHLHRGDRLAIIPILGDAEAEGSGRILRFDVPKKRQAYDADLRSFRLKLQASLTEMQANAIAHPGSKTDILGSVALAAQELNMDSREFRGRELTILSDFIQEDSELDFMTDKRLASSHSAAKFARALTKEKVPGLLRGATTYLGLMRSKEYTELNQRRRESLKEFWMEYFISSGASPTFVVDGVGLLGQGNAGIT